MKHRVTITTTLGRELETTPMETSAIIGLVHLMENASAGNVMVPWEWVTEPGPQRRRRHHQSYTRVCAVAQIDVNPPVWVGVRAMFLEAGSVWEILADSLGTGQPAVDALVRVEVVEEDRVALTLIATIDDRTAPGADLTLPLEAFVEVSSPASVDRLMDYRVTLADGDTIGRYPTDDELAARLS